jgi:large subunit ribosomal protein L35Ae
MAGKDKAKAKGVPKKVRRCKGKGPFLSKVHNDRVKKIEALKNKKTKVNRARGSPRLYMKGVLAGFRRGLNHQVNSTALLRIEDVNTSCDAGFYVGKRVAYVYHGYKKTNCVRSRIAKKRVSNTRAIWGKITRVHGSGGVVRAKFSPNLPGQAMGKRVRVYLFPSNI